MSEPRRSDFRDPPSLDEVDAPYRGGAARETHGKLELPKGGSGTAPPKGMAATASLAHGHHPDDVKQRLSQLCSKWLSNLEMLAAESPRPGCAETQLALVRCVAEAQRVIGPRG